MYVCLCSAVTVDDIIRYIKDNPKASLSDIMDALGVSINCGKCLPMVEKLITS